MRKALSEELEKSHEVRASHLPYTRPPKPAIARFGEPLHKRKEQE